MSLFDLRNRETKINKELLTIEAKRAEIDKILNDLKK